MADEIQMFDPDLLAVLLAVAETRSFTEAARLLNRSQSYVSGSIRRLEEAVGCQLVSRTTRFVLLTNDGEEMVRYARQVGELAEQARRRFSQPGCNEVVRLGVFTDFASLLLPDALREFTRRHDGVRLKVETNRSDLLLSRLRDGALDIVLATRQQGHGFGTPLWQDELVWIGRHAIPRNRREPIPLAVRLGPSMLRRLGIEALNVVGRPHVITFEGNSLHSVAAALAADMGISVFTSVLRPPQVPLIDRGLLPTLGAIDIVLLRTEHDRRPEVDTLHDILHDLSPALFKSAAAAMFG